jgi:hypothetical protein
MNTVYRVAGSSVFVYAVGNEGLLVHAPSERLIEGDRNMVVAEEKICECSLTFVGKPDPHLTVGRKIADLDVPLYAGGQFKLWTRNESLARGLVSAHDAMAVDENRRGVEATKAKFAEAFRTFKSMFE